MLSGSTASESENKIMFNEMTKGRAKFILHVQTGVIR